MEKLDIRKSDIWEKGNKVNWNLGKWEKENNLWWKGIGKIRKDGLIKIGYNSRKSNHSKNVQNIWTL